MLFKIYNIEEERKKNSADYSKLYPQNLQYTKVQSQHDDFFDENLYSTCISKRRVIIISRFM